MNAFCNNLFISGDRSEKQVDNYFIQIINLIQSLMAKSFDLIPQLAEISLVKESLIKGNN